MIAHNDSLEKKKKKLIHISEVCIFKKKNQKSYHWKSNVRRCKGQFGDEYYSTIRDLPSEYILSIQFYRRIILQCINQNN